MQFALTPDHREFFKKSNYLELEGIFPIDQVALLKKNAEETLASRLRQPVEKLSGLPPIDLYKSGYDLWRNNETIQKTAQKKAFAELASELLQTHPIRLALDQYICTTHNAAAPFSETLSLQEVSCISPLAGALILPLENLEQSLSFFPLPKNAGSGLFISSSLPIPWPQLYSTPGLRFFILGYTMKRASFKPDTRDPHAVNLKMLGYVFNDTLNDSLHPLLLRN